jgi:DNA-binding transcriptional MerR regulator/catechol 2,3-dioxygenase-like lactoylglutathione lyase family enzyme
MMTPVGVPDGDRLLGIGAFAVLSGLSITTLRHYDDVGILRPVHVDDGSGYRRYSTAQLRGARKIRALRAIDVPIDEILALLATDDETEWRAALVAHRERLRARADALTDMLSTIDGYIENGVTMNVKPPCRVAEINLGVSDIAAARRFYEVAFGVEFTEDHHEDGGYWHLLAAFGAWPSDEFFLLNIHEAKYDEFRAGRADFGMLVDDLEAVHARALTAGGTEINAPHDAEGMPRCSAVCDPSGNFINLYQNA